MPPAFRLGDKAQIAADAHGCPACPHPCIGPSTLGSPNVNTNARPQVRLQDMGIHSPCCGPNMWQTANGSSTVFVNGKPAIRLGDPTTHCGGSGQTVEGSGNVFIGG
jgi:uncharacterized Zn-binding protein involved in type VI secretion